MAIQYVGGVTGNAAGSVNTGITLSLTSLTGGIASAPQEGDLVVITIVSGSTVDRALSMVTSGYTTVADLYSNDTYDPNLYVGYKYMGSTPDTTAETSASGNNQDGIAAVIHVYRGVAPASVGGPFSATPTTSIGGNTSRPSFAAITPTHAGSWIIGAGGGAAATNTTAYTSSDLTNFLRDTGIDTNDGQAGMGYYTGWTSGAYTPATWGGGSNTTSDAWASVTMALEPEVIVALTANDLQSASNVTSPAITQIHPALANDLQSTSNVTTVAIAQVHSLSANDLQSVSNVTQPLVVATSILAANDLQSASNVTSPALVRVVNLLANDLQSASNVTRPVITQTHNVLANDLQSASNVSRPAVTQTNNLAANDLQSTSNVTSNTLVQTNGRAPIYGTGLYGFARYGTFQLFASGIQSVSNVTRPAATSASGVDITANDLQSASNVTRPTVGVVHNLLANDLQSASNVTRPAITQRHSILANDLQSASNVTRPTVGQANVLLANDLQSASNVTRPATTPIYNFNANDLQSTSNVTRPSITQKHNILANDLQSVSQNTQPDLSERQPLFANDLQSVSSVTTPAVGQKHNLNANDLQSASSVTTVGINFTRNLSANDLQSASNVATIRLVNVLPAVQDTTRTVYVAQEQFTVFVSSSIVAPVAHVTQDSKQRYAYSPPRNTTVYVQADNRNVYVGRNVA